MSTVALECNHVTIECKIVEVLVYESALVILRIRRRVWHLPDHIRSLSCLGCDLC